MAQNQTESDARTETERFDEDVSAAGLIEGDRIDRNLVARHPDQVGSPIRRTTPDEDPFPDIQLVAVTATDRMHDVHHALLLDPETGTFIRASRTDRQQAMNQAEADWKVRDIGSKIVVEEVSDLERPENEQGQEAHDYVQEWIEIVFDEIRHTGGDPSIQDELELTGTTLKLADYDGRKAYATISLED